MARALDHQVISRPYYVCASSVVHERRGRMLLYEYKLRLSRAQQAAIDEAIRTTQFIRNTCVRLWMDGRSACTNWWRGAASHPRVLASATCWPSPAKRAIQSSPSCNPTSSSMESTCGATSVPNSLTSWVSTARRSARKPVDSSQRDFLPVPPFRSGETSSILEDVLPKAHACYLNEVSKPPPAWSPDGRLLASAAKDGAVRVESVEDE
jgi:hypothetical protein